MEILTPVAIALIAIIPSLLTFYMSNKSFKARLANKEIESNGKSSRNYPESLELTEYSSKENTTDECNCKLASIYWAGNDLSFTINAIKNRDSVKLIRHGIIQFLHHIDSSNIACLNLSYLRGLRPFPGRLASNYNYNDLLDDDTHEKLTELLNNIKKELTGCINNLQPDYTPYPDGNGKPWDDLKF